MIRSRTLQLLAEHKGLLAQRFGVISLALFGSTVRNDAREDSDVDILVAFGCSGRSRLLVLIPSAELDC